MDKKNTFLFVIVLLIAMCLILIYEYFNENLENFFDNKKIIYPISFAIHESLFMTPNIRNKKYDFAPMVP